MNYLGSPIEWIDLLDSLVPDILALVVDAWETMPPPPPNAKEDSISESLCAVLRRSRDRCDLPFRIDSQMVELEPTAGEDQGRMDIAFSPLVPRESIYFCLECKRINVKDEHGVRPYFSEYVRFGMFRFVRGQYSSAVRNGGMLAFVLDGDVSGAIIGIQDNIQRLREELGMDEPGAFQVSSVRPMDTRVRETSHRRGFNRDPFVIHHVFVAGDPTVSMLPESPMSRASAPRTTKRKVNRRAPK